MLLQSDCRHLLPFFAWWFYSWSSHLRSRTLATLETSTSFMPTAANSPSGITTRTFYHGTSRSNWQLTAPPPRTTPLASTCAWGSYSSSAEHATMTGLLFSPRSSRCLLAASSRLTATGEERWKSHDDGWPTQGTSQLGHDGRPIGRTGRRVVQADRSSSQSYYNQCNNFNY